jgi:hypothetical protein
MSEMSVLFHLTEHDTAKNVGLLSLRCQSCQQCTTNCLAQLNHAAAWEKLYKY